MVKKELWLRMWDLNPRSQGYEPYGIDLTSPIRCMSPAGDDGSIAGDPKYVELQEGLEPSTACLQDRCSAN